MMGLRACVCGRVCVEMRRIKEDGEEEGITQ